MVAPEGEAGFDAGVQGALVQIGDDQVLEHRPAQRMGGEFLGVANAQQIAQEAGVHEVELGVSGEAPVEALMVRRQAEHHETRLQHG